MPPNPGLVILDTNCLHHLEARDERQRVLASLRSADMEIWPTAVNALEVAKNRSPAIRTVGLEILADLASGRGLLPFPDRMLARAAHSIQAGTPGFMSGLSGMESMLEDPANLPETIRAGVDRFMAKVEDGWTEMHDRARQTLQPIIKKRGLRDAWVGLPEFLDGQWMRPDQLDTMVQGLWKRLGVKGRPPMDRVLATETWRLFLEAEGAAVFERAIVTQQPKRVHHADLLQLVYLAGARRRVLVTNDGPLLRVARVLLTGRYGLSRALSWGEFAALHQGSP